MVGEEGYLYFPNVNAAANIPLAFRLLLFLDSFIADLQDETHLNPLPDLPKSLEMTNHDRYSSPPPCGQLTDKKRYRRW